MKRFEYLKLNFNMSTNETMIAMILAAIAPLVASLGERESIRSFLMGTDGPSMLQLIAGGGILVVAMVFLIKGNMKIAYESFVGEAAQMFSTLPISLTMVALIKIIVLSVNTLIVLVGLGVGTTMAWVFGNNETINVLVNYIVGLAKSGIFEQVMIIPTSILLIVAIVFSINECVLVGFCNFMNTGGKESNGGLAKIGLILLATVPMLLILGNFIRTSIKTLSYIELEDLWISLLQTTGLFVLVGVVVFGIIAYRVNHEYTL